MGYFLEHPESLETFEGIVYWVLTTNDVKSRITEVREGLTVLVSQGWIRCLQIPSRHGDSASLDRLVYKINTDRLEEIASMLKQAEDIQD